MTERKPRRRTAERILETTLDLFNRFGEPNVSTTLISNELGISPGNLYYHYPAKDELVNALFTRYKASMLELLVSAPQIQDLEDAWFFVHQLMERVWAHRFIYRDLNDLLSRNRRLEAEIPSRELWDLYLRLRAVSPADHGAWLAPGRGKALLSISPETFLRVRGRRVETEPIKGTRPRGSDEAADAAAVTAAPADAEDPNRGAWHHVRPHLAGGRVIALGTARTGRPGAAGENGTERIGHRREGKTR